MEVEKVVNKMSLKARTNDTAYWRAQPPEVRLAALEDIRREYHRWKFRAEPRLQRVYSITRHK